MNTEINPATMLPFFNPDYQVPSSDDIRALLKSQSWTGARAAVIAGVDSRTVRRWTGAESPIPYSCWRLLLINAGLADR